MPYPALNVLCIEKQKQEFGCGKEKRWRSGAETGQRRKQKLVKEYKVVKWL